MLKNRLEKELAKHDKIKLMEKPETLGQTIISLNQSLNNQNTIIVNKRFQRPEEENRLDIIAIPGHVKSIRMTDRLISPQILTYYAKCLGKYSVEAINQLNINRNSNYRTYQPEVEIGIGLSNTNKKIRQKLSINPLQSQLEHNFNTLKNYYESNQIDPENELEFLIVYSALDMQKLNISSDIVVDFSARQIGDLHSLFVPGIDFNFSPLNKKSLAKTNLINRNYLLKINHPLINAVIKESIGCQDNKNNFILGINDFRLQTPNDDYLLNLESFFTTILSNQDQLKKEINQYQTITKRRSAVWKFINDLSFQTLQIKLLNDCSCLKN